MAFPITVSAQYDDEETTEEVVTRKIVRAQKKYDTRTVKGIVIDAATGKGISGAMVKAHGVNGYSALTNDLGEYEVKVPVFASSLYITSPDYNSVIIGLAKEEKQTTAKLLSSTFSADYSDVENVLNDHSANDFKYSNAINIKEEVQKQLGAYAYVTQKNGTPGIGATTFVQGLNSLNVNAQPLVVLDGVILDQQYTRSVLHSGFYNDILSNINPADIADVTVMRNGTALYGARGANGVIIINTKRSHTYATKITASLSAGVTFEPKYYEMMDAEQYRGYASELLKGTGTKITSFKFLNEDPNYYYYKQYHNNTDWKDMIYHNAFTQNHGINVEGGDDVAQYSLSVGYTSAQSTLEKNDMDRLNVRFNSDILLTEKLSVRFDASFSNLTRSIRDDSAPYGYDEGTPTAPAFLAYVKSPFMSPYSYGNGKISDSFLDITPESYLDEALVTYSMYNYRLGNPVAINEYGNGENKNRFENSLLNLAITPKWKFNNKLELSEHFSYTLVNTNEKHYIPINGVPAYYVTSVSGIRNNQVSSLAAKQNSYQSDTRLTWKNRYEAHDVALFGGARFNIENYSTSSQLGYNTGSDKTPFMSGNLANVNASGVDESWNNIDAYIQGNYSYLDRYFAQVNLTASASSRFGSKADGLSLLGVKWGLFPSVQGSWVITNEPWFAKVKGIDYLRLTAGFDVSGNDNIDVFAARSYYASNLYLNSIASLSFEGIGNTKIKWETTRRFNIGLEGNFVNNRIHAGFNYFTSTTDDLLSLQSLGYLSGIKYNWANAGKLNNQGFDANINGKIIANKNWGWTLGASVGHYENKIAELAEGVKSIKTQIGTATILTEVGSPANLFYGYKTEGVYSTTENANAAGKYILDKNGVDKVYFQAGDINFTDIDGNKEINEKDMTVIGNPNPDIYGNIFSALQWKRLRLDVNFTYSLGNDVFNYMRSQLESGSRFMNQTVAMTQRWQSEGQETSIPRISFQDNMGNSRFSDRWIEDGSYLKLKSVTLSYDIPINSTFLQGLQFWVQGNNLFTLTRYLGTDPEFSSTSAVIGHGIDYGSVGSSRSIVAGVKINL